MQILRLQHSHIIMRWKVIVLYKCKIKKNHFPVCSSIRSHFSKILNYNFKEGDTADGVLSHIADSPQVMYPPISTQKDFGYSDIIQRQPMFL